MIGTLQIIQGLLIWTINGPCDNSIDENQKVKELLMFDFEHAQANATEYLLAMWESETNISMKEQSTRNRRDSSSVKKDSSSANKDSPAINQDSSSVNQDSEENSCEYNITDPEVRRLYEMLDMGHSITKEDYNEFDKIIVNMRKTYSTAKICDFRQPKKCDLSLEPEITELLSSSSNVEELKYLWVKYREATGKKIRKYYPRYVEIGNKWAKSGGYADMGKYWLRTYNDKNIINQIDTIWSEIKPLYVQLHTYVRRQLFLQYGEDVLTKNGPIPAHLLREMKAAEWYGIANMTVPFAGKKLPDVSKEMKKQGYNVKRMFRLAEKFYVSLNMSAMPELFWNKSILEKPKDVEVNCHPSAWDFLDGKDYRIKMCARINMADLLIACHEMGHIEYAMAYRNQPRAYRRSAHVAIDEAIGDVISLSVSTPSYLKTVRLLDKTFSDTQTSLNSLYLVALSTIPVLPFAYTLEKWRWGVFDGTILPDAYNCKWWSLLEEHQGIEPPIDRSEEDFDPGSVYHIAAHYDYIRYFSSFVIKFQFHKALCIEAGQYDPLNPRSKPLHECNIYGSTKAGNLLKSMMELGRSKPWQDAMEIITGQRKIDSSGILEYFQPLLDWLKHQNAKTNEYIGWKSSKRTCRGTWYGTKRSGNRALSVCNGNDVHEREIGK